LFYLISLFVKKNNQGDTYEDEDEDEDYAIYKAISKHCAREFIEEQKAFYRLEDLDL
jgi:hypothetical protein